MKRIFALVISIVLLSGCSAQETFETVNDNLHCVAPEVRDIALTLPGDASVMTFESGERDKLYICDGYTVSVCVMDSGDINKTLVQTTGFPRDSLKIVETAVNGMKRYDGVWTCAGEQEEQVGNVTVIDDGAYHYVMTILGNASDSGDMAKTWNKMKRSFGVIDTDQALSGT